MPKKLTSFQELPESQAFCTLFDGRVKIKVGNGYRLPSCTQITPWEFIPETYVDDFGLTGDEVESLSLLTNS